MIPKAYITEWRTQAPWAADAWVEQDLVITRALVAIFGHAELAKQLAFRGGTALHKLHIRPAARYSEDIDLVQLQPIGPTLDALQDVLNPWLGKPKRLQKEGRVNLLYRFDSEDASPIPLRLKIETNTREHFAVAGVVAHRLEVQNRWFSGAADVSTFAVEELLGTKLRALYQRKKGRDLFDLAVALEQLQLDHEALLGHFRRYLAAEQATVSRAQFEANMYLKGKDAAFRGDIAPLLRPGVSWDFDAALALVSELLIARLPGDAWRGNERGATGPT